MKASNRLQLATLVVREAHATRRQRIGDRILHLDTQKQILKACQFMKDMETLREPQEAIELDEELPMLQLAFGSPIE
jgi:hypothetical protein